MSITYNETGVTYDSTSYTWDGGRYQPSVFPVAGIFVAWDDGPYVANPTWTEVTSDVRSFQTHRGRGSDFDQFDTGTAQITFDNRTRKYDPFYTSGTYYGKLLPRRQVKIVAQIGGVTYDVYRGFISGWPVTWSEYGKDSTVTVQCFDALGLMVNEQVPTDWADYITRAIGPARYFKCNDSAATAVARDSVGSGTVQLVNDLPATYANMFETSPMGDGLLSTSLFFPRYTVTDSTISSGDAVFSVAFWLRGTSGLTSTYNNIVVGYGGSSFIVNVTASEIRVSVYTPSITYVRTINIGYYPSYGQPFHMAIVGNPVSADRWNPTYYINGVQAATTFVSSTGGLRQDALKIDINFLNLQEIAFFTKVLTATEVAAIYNAGRSRITETTSARMTRILDTTSWPAALESFPASPAGTVAEIGSGTGVIQELQLVADSEGGELYATKAGVLTMTARRDVFNATRSANVQATISDSGAGIRYGSEIDIAYDADNLKNDVTVNYSGDGEVVQTNTVTIAAYGAAATVIETQLDSPTSANDLATLELGVEGVLVPQLSTIDISPNTAAADWQSILALELLDRVNFKRTPTVGNQFSRDALINAIDHQVEPGQWRTQVTLSMRYTSPLTCDDPVLGKVDYNYCG